MSAPIVMCNKCFTADDVTGVLKDGKYIYTCRNHGAQDNVWTVAAPQPKPKKAPVLTQAGFLASVGADEALLDCIKPDDPWLEYGVVEDRFRRANKELYKTLVDKYLHSARNASRGGPDTDPPNRSVSKILAAALGRLAKEGLISQSPAKWKATGYWHFDGTVAYWAPVPAPPTEKLLTWVDYATQNGMDPEKWSLP